MNCDKLNRYIKNATGYFKNIVIKNKLFLINKNKLNDHL
jgi:hypothetical protein